MKQWMKFLAPIVCAALLLSCSGPSASDSSTSSASGSSSSTPAPVSSGSSSVSAGVQTSPAEPDLSTEAGIREYLVGEWWYDTGDIDAFVCQMNIDSDLNISLTFENFGTGEKQGPFTGKVTLDYIYVQPPKAPDLIRINLGADEARYPGGECCFTHRTVFENRYAMSWYFMGNGNSVFGLLDESGFDFPPDELTFTKDIGETPSPEPRKNADFYAVFWGYSGFHDYAVWLDELTVVEPDFSPVYPWERAYFENEVKVSTAYTIHEDIAMADVGLILTRGYIYLVHTNAQGEIILMADVDYTMLADEGEYTVDPYLSAYIWWLAGETDEIAAHLDMGMDIFIPGLEERIDGEWCTVFWIGMDYGEHFEADTIYAVNENNSQIYRYDDAKNTWEALPLG